jgi:hypothetical protein
MVYLIRTPLSGALDEAGEATESDRVLIVHLLERERKALRAVYHAYLPTHAHTHKAHMARTPTPTPHQGSSPPHQGSQPPSQPSGQGLGLAGLGAFCRDFGLCPAALGRAQVGVICHMSCITIIFTIIHHIHNIHRRAQLCELFGCMLREAEVIIKYTHIH